jgi:hypothetical protein
MNPTLQAFEGIAELLTELGPRIDHIDDIDNDVFMETLPLMIGGKMVARVFGPWRSEEEAEQYLSTKRDRNRVRAAAHFRDGGEIENDGHLFCHEAFQYRYIAAAEYSARYLAQIVVLALGGLVSLTKQPDTEQVFRSPTDDDEDEEEDES